MSSQSDSKVFKELPKVHTTYANIIKSLLPVGDKPKVSKDQLPKVRYQVDSLSLDKDNLDDYRKICGFYNTGNVPITYYAVLSQALQMNMMAKEAFPFAMLGLVHVENKVTQYRPIADNEVVALSVELDNLRDHDKGQQFDFVTKVSKDDELIWEGVSTYLSRSKSSDKTKKPSEKKTSTDTLNRDDASVRIFEVPEDIGRRYAFVSGDFNLIHIHPLSAKAFGFPKAIAHGMWSKAKCLAQINDLPTAYSVDVSFKLPILLPAEVELVTQKPNVQDADKERQFALYSAKNGKPHLSGVITAIESVK